MKSLAMTRRRWMQQALKRMLLLGSGAAARAVEPAAPRAHFPFGPVLPVRPIPALRVTTHRGQATTLDALLQGRITALQWMFTGCSAMCPIQGALFAQTQAALARETAGTEAKQGTHAVQLVSLSIDPLGDSPAALAAWLQRFGAGSRWQGVVPRVGDVDRIVALLGSGGDRRPTGADPHTGQVFIIDAQGALVFRTSALPPAGDIVAALRAVRERAR
jgi:protein SCO1/2